jgi:hypothetical protein
MNNTYYLQKSSDTKKKYDVLDNNKKLIVSFGANGYEDYTTHKDPERKLRYIERHAANENWNKAGIKTAGFWSRWILWNKPSFRNSIEDTKKKFNIDIIFSK